MQSAKNRINKDVFKELAKKNVKKSGKDYIVYFFTLTMAVCLFYTFNSIGAQFKMIGIPDTLNYLSFSIGVIAVVSVFICMVMGFLVVYANRFMLRRRKKEIGIYSVLGMEQKDISDLMMQETILIGMLSMAAGIIIGIFASQGLALITARIIGSDIGGFRPVISPGAIVFSVIFFGLLFFFVHVFNMKEIKKMRLIELIHAERRNEGMPVGKKSTVWVFPLSILLIGAGYVWMINKVSISIGSAFLIGGGLVSAGTIMFFLSASGFLIRMAGKYPGFYYKRLNMFVVSQIAGRMKSAGVSVAVTCILLFFASTVMSVGLGTGSSIMEDIEQKTPYDVSLNWKQKEVQPSVEEFAKEPVVLTRYTSDLKHSDFLLSEYNGKDKEVFGNYKTYILGVDDYNRAMKIQGKKEIILGSGEYAVNYDVKEAEPALKYFVEEKRAPLTVNGTELKPAEDGLYKRTYQNNNVLWDIGTVIVPQKLAEQLKADSWICNFNFAGNPKEMYEKFTAYRLKHMPIDIESEIKTDVLVDITSSNLISTYVGVYLGITFLIIAGTVLALQQLSQSSDNEKRYELLRRLGTREKDMKSSVTAQLAVYFAVPFIMAVMHSIVVTTGIYVQINISAAQAAGNILLSAGMVSVVYAIYYMITYAGSRRMLKL